jgi:predicted GNAT family N-acyltransferase
MMDSHVTSHDTTGLSQRLPEFLQPVRFAAGEELRRLGQHYAAMYLVTSGEIEVDLGDKGGVLHPALQEPGLAIGEIGFLRGLPATATVRALTDVAAFKIDDASLSQLEQKAPDIAVALLRFLGETAEERTSENISIAASLEDAPKDQSIRVLLCRNDDMLMDAQKLRYKVYCQELGRTSPHADHETATIIDELDAAGHTFLAVEDGQAIGTLRANRPSEGPIGILESLYGMDASDAHPEGTIVCTKFVIRSDKRKTAAGIKLVAAFARYSVQHGIRECYIDCIPSLRPFYMGMGFRKSGEKFLHRENGPSYPMKIDLEKSQRRIERILFTVS